MPLSRPNPSPETTPESHFVKAGISFLVCCACFGLTYVFSTVVSVKVLGVLFFCGALVSFVAALSFLRWASWGHYARGRRDFLQRRNL